MRDIARNILQQVIDAGGRVEPDTFTGCGNATSWCVRYGWLEWERGNAPRCLKATGILITPKGREALQQTPGE